MARYKNLSKETFKVSTMVKKYQDKKRPFWKFFKDKEPQLIEDGGWHFSFLKEPASIKKNNFLFSSRI